MFKPAILRAQHDYSDDSCASCARVQYKGSSLASVLLVSSDEYGI